jgi:hypothetical protein
MWTLGFESSGSAGKSNVGVPGVELDFAWSRTRDFEDLLVELKLRLLGREGSVTDKASLAFGLTSFNKKPGAMGYGDDLWYSPARCR